MNPESPTPRRFNTSRWVIGLTVAIVIMVGLPILLVWYSIWSAGQRVDEQLAAIRAKGEPVTPDELNAFYAVPPADRDVTPLILNALRPLDNPALGQATQGLSLLGQTGHPIPPPGQPWEERAPVELLLNQYSPALQALHDAANKRGVVRFPMDFNQGFNTLLPDTQNVRSGARLLTLEAHVRAHQGDAHGAADSIRALLALGNVLENEPMLISQLVRIAVRSMGYELIRELLPHVEFSDDDLRELQLAVRAADYRASLHRAMIGERVLGKHSFRNPGGTGITPRQLTMLRLISSENDDLSLYLESMNSLVDAVRVSWIETRAVGHALNKMLKERRQSTAWCLQHTMTVTNLPEAISASLSGGIGEARKHLTDIALAIERFRRKHGRPPKNLEELVPNFLPMVPLDPFADQPLRFKSSGDGLLIYSVGSDGIDNGGTEDSGKAEPDIVIRVGTPSAAKQELPPPK